MLYTHQNRRAPGHLADESRKPPLRVDFDRRLKLEFHGSKITSDVGFLAYRELDDALGLTEIAGDVFQGSRTGKNGWHGMTGQFRQSLFGRVGGYEDVNDAERLGRDPAMPWIVGGKAVERQAASTSQMGRFETELLARDANIEALIDMNGVWIDRVHERRPPEMIILDMDSSVSPTHGEQEGTAYNGHFGCTCYHPLFLFNQFGDLERCALRSGNVHSADGWRDVLEPVVERYRERNLRRYFRGDDHAIPIDIDQGERDKIIREMCVLFVDIRIQFEDVFTQTIDETLRYWRSTGPGDTMDASRTLSRRFPDDPDK